MGDYVNPLETVALLSEKLAEAHARIATLEEANEYYLGVVERLCKQIPGVERHQELLAEIERLRGGLGVLLRAAKAIEDFAVSWEPLTPGDIGVLKAGIVRADRALAGKGETDD